MSACSEIANSVKNYYGKAVKTFTCKKPHQDAPKHVQDALKLVHEEVVSKYYGCGLTVPECLEGMKVLDLGSGCGHDCYAIAKLVGETGFVTGIDMTDEQIEVSRKYVEYHQKAFNYPKPNTAFMKGYLEDLQGAGIADESIDIIVSNCVICLCKDKKLVLEEAFRVLKYGGELFFSDMYTDKELSKDLQKNAVLWGEGYGGSLHWKTLYQLAKDIGFEVPHVVRSTKLEICNPEIKALVEDSRYASVIYRLFKLPPNIKRSENEVVYKGTMTGYEKMFQLDYKTRFPEGETVTVDQNTSAILQNSRFQAHFKFDTAQATTLEVTEEDPFEIAAKIEKMK